MPATKIAVIETRLPYTDRRALSEAWFSALHLARDAQPDASAPPAKTRAAAPESGAASRQRSDRPAPDAAPRRERSATVERAGRRAAYAGFDVSQRRAGDARGAVAERASFERARSYPPFRTSLTLEGANGTRVHLIVRRVGPTLHVVALCPRTVEPLVRKALANADIHFRTRGERLQIDVNAGTPA